MSGRARSDSEPGRCARLNAVLYGGEAEWIVSGDMTISFVPSVSEEAGIVSTRSRSRVQTVQALRDVTVTVPHDRGRR